MNTLQEISSCLSEHYQKMARDEAIKVLKEAKKQNRPVIFLPQGINGEMLKKFKKNLKQNKANGTIRND